MANKVHLLDYVAGNIRSLVNAIERCGFEVEWIKSPEDVKNADVRNVSSIIDAFIQSLRYSFSPA
jgi:imidazoleglycerol phosphate synthase glutamine amidotransferase subunit HisH